MPARTPRVLTQQQQDIQHLCQKIEEGDEEGVVEQLLRKPELVNLKDARSGFCPLHVAARYNQPKIVDILINKGAEVNAQSRDQESTALHIAARLKDRKRLAAEEQAQSQQQDEQNDFLNFLQQENNIAPAQAPGPADSEQTTTLLLMNRPDIDPNVKDRLQETPLHYAARWGNTAECRLILEKGCSLRQNQVDVNAKDKDGLTPLHHTCLHMCSKNKETQSRQLGETKHYHEIAELLIKYQADCMATDNNGNTPLHLAADEGCLEITEKLLEAAASDRTTDKVLAARNVRGDTALNIAVRRDYYEVTRYILSRGTNEIGVADEDGDTPLHNCKHVGIFKTLLENLPDVNARDKDGATPLHVAARDGRVQMLVEFEKLKKDQRQGLDEVEFFNCTDNDDRTPLVIASRYGRNAIVTRLLKNKAVINGAKDKEGKTALYLAAEYNHIKVLEAMFDGDGPMLNYLEETATSKLQTPLHIAAINGHLDVVKILIQNGAQVRAKHHGGKTPLHLACQYGQYDVVQELVQYESAAIHDTNDKKNTPLHCAARWGHIQVVQFLIDNKASLDAITDTGKTPLYVAAKHGWSKTCHLLIENGADVAIEDKSLQRTALQIACINGHESVVEILLNYWCSEMNKQKGQRTLEGGSAEVTDWNGFLSHRDSKGKNCLDLAIENNHENIAELIIETEGAWQFVMRNCDPGEVNTPMRKLIRCMPGVAEIVFTKCITKRTVSGGSNVVRFDYTFLDDANERKSWLQDSKQSKSMEDKQRTYKTYKKTHVLTVLSKTERMELLSHPLVSALLRKKTRSCSMFIFYLQLILYIVFLAFLTAFMVSSTPPYEFEDNEKYQLVGNGTICEKLEAGGYKQTGYSIALQYITLVFAAFLLISEVIQLYQKKKGYFEFDNFIEWLIFIFAIIVTIDFTPCSDATNFRYKSLYRKLLIKDFTETIKARSFKLELQNCSVEAKIYCLLLSSGQTLQYLPVTLNIVSFGALPVLAAPIAEWPWQWSFGTASLFFGWINLALYLQKFPTIGIYIMMLKDILATFLEFFLVYILFIVAFALAFYAEIRNVDAYKTVWLSLVKTAVMMTGEFDYGDDYVQGTLHNTVAVYILFTCFMVIMTILLMNLLTGLAVDDIKEIQNKASLKRLQMQIDLVLDLESVVQAGFCCKVDTALTEEIILTKSRKLPFNLNNYVGKQSFGLTIEAVERALSPAVTEVDKIQEEQYNLRQQNEKLKEKLNEQADTLKSLDEKLNLLIERLPEQQR